MSVSNATKYVDETDQMRPYDRDVATTQDARDSLNDGAGSNVDDDSVDIENKQASTLSLGNSESVTTTKRYQLLGLRAADK